MPDGGGAGPDGAGPAGGGAGLHGGGAGPDGAGPAGGGAGLHGGGAGPGDGGAGPGDGGAGTAGGGGGGSRPAQRERRQRAIAEAVLAAGSARIDTLARQFGISVMTVHRDLDELAARGLLHKSRGAATALPSRLVESSDVFRRGQQAASKRALARAAMRLLEPGQAVILDDSTTTFAMAPLLARRAPLTVITNYLPLMNELVGEKEITLVGLCGEYHGWAGSFLGGLTVDALSRLRADVVVMSTSAVQDGVCYHPARETVDTKRAMLAAAATRVLLLDHTKFARRALHALAPLTDFHQVLVDPLTPESHRAELRRRGVEVTVVALPDGPDHPELVRT